MAAGRVDLGGSFRSACYQVGMLNMNVVGLCTDYTVFWRQSVCNEKWPARRDVSKGTNPWMEIFSCDFIDYLRSQ